MIAVEVEGEVGTAVAGSRYCGKAGIGVRRAEQQLVFAKVLDAWATGSLSWWAFRIVLRPYRLDRTAVGELFALQRPVDSDRSDYVFKLPGQFIVRDTTQAGELGIPRRAANGVVRDPVRTERARKS